MYLVLRFLFDFIRSVQGGIKMEETMGNLLKFVPQAPEKASVRRKKRTQTTLKSVGAEIILFPGVRYERHSLDLEPRIGTIMNDGDVQAAERDGS